MSKLKHVEILRQGENLWNDWRAKNMDVIPDFDGIDLSGMNLREFNFTRVNLCRAKLVETILPIDLSWSLMIDADLTQAKLKYSNLTRANLCGANLNKAELQSANLSHAQFVEGNGIEANFEEAKLLETNLSCSDLTGANLKHSSLNFANFTSTSLIDTNFTGSIIGDTIFGDVNLSVAKGLDSLIHIGPSIIGIDTIYRSEGKVPELFLRKCGIPDIFIDYAHSLTESPILFYSCFISYSTKDESFAERLYQDLLKNGVRVWYAPKDIKIGDKFRNRIEEAIRNHDRIMIVLSKNSISSPWVEKEVETTFEREIQQKKILMHPIRLDNSVMKTNLAWAADIRRTRHIGDFSNWKDQNKYEVEFKSLLRALKTELTS